MDSPPKIANITRRARQAQRPLLVHVTTVPMSLMFLRGQARYMSSRGLTLRAISSPGPELAQFASDESVAVDAVPMSRQISPFADLVALTQLARRLLAWRPDIVHAHTPKGGLLGMIAAWVCRVPLRIYHIRGLPFVTATGLRRRLLRMTERVSCRLANEVLCVSHSARELAIAEGLCPAEKIKVLAGGSGNGVDALGRFNPSNLTPDARQRVRRTHQIPADATVVGFVGRIVRDKGLIELTQAWQRLRADRPNVHLLLVGPFEPQDPLPVDVEQALRSDDRIHLAGAQRQTADFYAAMDLVVLPTYREGFPNVPLEAAAMGLPVVATRIPGCTDAVADGVTGTLVPVRDALALGDTIANYLHDPELRHRHGQAGRERVLRDFRQDVIWEAMYQEYRHLLSDGGRRVPRKQHNAMTKRLFDIIVGSLAAIILLPVILLVAVLVRTRLGSPILFRQPRPGLGGRTFLMYKFRTMTDERDAAGNLLPDARRLTKLGKFLRSSSLDELPELINVLKGDMSLVGPRPLLVEYLERYNPRQARRHEVRPGVTGLAQINGRNALTWEQKFELDLWYVEHHTLWLDLKIILRTLIKVFRREGISQAGQATVQPFQGSDSFDEESLGGTAA